ncbi:formimidoylglutamase [Facilibium subflavum]|uniref:formimidoylglutamase n=1 Tax=Facilibium subflavum TaxID=2219058 RepID=UPI000E652DDC|nr:formimidoylglutamase [Facilibium subflavum]
MSTGQNIGKYITKQQNKINSSLMYICLKASLQSLAKRHTNIERQYFYQIAQPIDLDDQQHLKEITNQSNQHNYIILGFCCDIGVVRNHGIAGAKLGPDAFRKQFYNLPVHQDNFQLFDAGDIMCDAQTLEQAQKTLATYVDKIIDSGAMPIIIGGGHETAWGHLQGIYKHNIPAIVNFDAHFDLRQTLQDDKGSSGTPFYQALQYTKTNNKPFHYYCLGIQPFANTRDLFAFADENHVKYQLAETIHKHPDTTFIDDIIKKHRQIYISICLDVFNASIAPGVSADQPLGIDPFYVVDSLRKLKKSNQIISLDIVELNPQKDIDNKTAKLAGILLAEYLHA